MDNEQQKAKELAKLLNAFAETKKLEFFNDANGWCDYAQSLHCMVEEFWDGVEFRTKPETQRVALTMQDMIDRVKANKTLAIIRDKEILNYGYIDNIGIRFYAAGVVTTYENLLSCTFADGTSCYKEVESE